MDLTARFQQIMTELLCRLSIGFGFTGWLKKNLLKFKLSVFTGRMFLPRSSIRSLTKTVVLWCS